MCPLHSSRKDKEKIFRLLKANKSNLCFSFSLISSIGIFLLQSIITECCCVDCRYFPKSYAMLRLRKTWYIYSMNIDVLCRAMISWEMTQQARRPLHTTDVIPQNRTPKDVCIRRFKRKCILFTHLMSADASILSSDSTQKGKKIINKHRVIVLTRCYCVFFFFQSQLVTWWAGNGKKNKTKKNNCHIICWVSKYAASVPVFVISGFHFYYLYHKHIR